MEGPLSVFIILLSLNNKICIYESAIIFYKNKSLLEDVNGHITIDHKVCLQKFSGNKLCLKRIAK